MAKVKVINPSLEHTYKKSLSLEMTDDDSIVIFSDFHMGNGKSSDDFLKNGDMVGTILKDYYQEKNWNLILNGDIEELQKFSLPKIRERWSHIYDIFKDFQKDNKFYKICGNHDDKLLLELSHQQIFPLYDAVTLRWSNQDFFIYHGHQSSAFYNQFNKIIEFGLHYIVRPLRIKNYSDRNNNWKKHRLESQSYQFSLSKKIVSLIGHTHRPLFESLSRKEVVKYQIEYLLRTYRSASGQEHIRLKSKLHKLKAELDELTKDDRFIDPFRSIYSDEIVIPCLFNSGCAIGKRGITCIELSKGKISLVYWFNRNIPQKRPNLLEKSTPIKGTDYNRVVIKRDDISYISDCIKLFLD